MTGNSSSRLSFDFLMSLRILFVSTGLGIGGAERTLQRLVIELTRRGHQLCVCSLGRDDVIGEELTHVYKSLKWRECFTDLR